MISLGTVTWNTGPTIKATFAYEKKRDGADMQYRAQVTISTVSGSSYFGYPIYLGLYIGGSWRETATVKAVNPYRWTSEIVYTSGWYTITGKTSGTTPISFNLYSGLGYSYSQTYDYDMEVDPAASFLSVSNGTLGTAQTVEVKWYDSTFKHKITYSCGSASGYVAGSASTYASSTKPSWTPPLSLAAQNTTGLSVSISLTVYTYTSGGTQVGTSKSVITCAIPASVKPSCTCTLEDITGVDDNYGSPVQGLSKIKVTVNATPSQGSPIKAYSININGMRYTTNPATTGVLIGEDASVVTVTVTDERNRTSDPWTYDMKVQNYTPPSVSKLTVTRCNADGTENDQGQYVQATFSAAVSSMNSKNTAKCVLRYKKSSTDTWTVKDFSTTNPYTYTYTNKTHIFSADESSSYDVEVVVTDRHDTVSRSTSASTAFSLMDFHQSGRALRFGGVAEEDNTFQNDLEFRQVGNRYAFQPEAFSGEKGYTALAEIKLNTLNVNAPVVFVINRRGALCPMTVYVRFASSSTTTDPGLGSITYEGDNYNTYLIKTAVSTWRLYVDNTSGWTNPCLQDWFTTDNQQSRLSVSFPNEQLSGTTTDALTGASTEGVFYKATPAKMQSLLDHIYPVGSVYISYSHTSPASLFGGTWVRIENRFLWATTSGGTIGQTGGAQTHTHTLNNAYAYIGFSYNSTYSNFIGGKFVDLGSWTGNLVMTKMNGYTTPSYGNDWATTLGGNADSASNMPPYIQVSIWRRTE